MCNRPGYTMQTLNKYLEDRDTTFSSPDWQVTFVDNHDMPRFSTALRSSERTFGSGNNEQGGGFSKDFAKKRLELAVAVIMSVRGIPCIYYGTEQYAANFTENAFGQVGSDPYNREMMPSFSKSSDLYGIIKKMILSPFPKAGALLIFHKMKLSSCKDLPMMVRVLRVSAQ